MSKTKNEAEKATKIAEEKNTSLDIIRRDLKVPKSRRNDFGGYDYRSCEDILNALKPLMFKHGVTIHFNEEIQQLGERFYVKCTATFIGEDGEEAETSGYAREEETRKGMSADQITGSASSYARKYALNAMFLIDDSAEPDAHETISSEEAAEIKSALEVSDSDVTKFLAWAGCSSVEKMPKSKLKKARQIIAGKGGGSKS